MKHLLLLSALVLLSGSKLEAHSQPPITHYLQFSKTICIVKATEVTGNIATFLVEEVVKGTPPKILKLSFVEVPTPITKNSEWLLASAKENEDTLGWALDGDDGWVNAPVRRVNGKIHLVGKYGYVDPQLDANPSTGLTLDEMRKLAKTPPIKH